MNEGIKALLGIFAVSILVVTGLGLIGLLQAQGYKEATEKLCSEYQSVPEKYIDKIPTRCLTQYFKEKNN